MTEQSRMATISPSQLDSMSCRLAWHLGYKLGYKPKRSSLALEFGTGIHHALEKYYSKQDGLVEAFLSWCDERISNLDAQWQDDLDKLIESKDLGKGMLEGYLKEYEGKEKFEVICTEKPLKRELIHPDTKEPTGVFVSIRLDGLVRDLTVGKLFSLEHKTFERYSPDHFERDHQMTSQVWVGQSLVESLGLEETVYGVIYNGLRKQLPSSKTKLKLFERHKVYRNQRQIEVFLHRAYWQYMEHMRPDLPIYPQPNLVRCGQCDFKQVCTSYMLGEDWRFILEEFYTCNRRTGINTKT